MSSRTYLRIILYGFVALLLALYGWGGIEFTFLTGTLVGLALMLAAAGLTYYLQRDLLPSVLFLVYLFASAIVVERAAVLFSINGVIAVLVWLVLSVTVGLVYRRRANEGPMRSRAGANRAAHQALVAERQQLAAQMGLGYEERSAALALGFGRVEQDVPDDVLKLMPSTSPGQVYREHAEYQRMQVRLKHAAGMEAESVIYAQVGGFPVSLFELELISFEKVAGLMTLGTFSKLDQAAEVSKEYLSVGMATLPFALPFVSSTYAYALDGSYHYTYTDGDEGWSRPNDAFVAESAPGALHSLPPEHPEYAQRREHVWRLMAALMTENEELARLLLSVPAVRTLTLEPNPMLPWFVDGGRLVASELTPAGMPANRVQGVFSVLGALLEAIPWSDLDRFRTGPSVPVTSHSQRFFRTYRQGEPGATLERWDEQPTQSGVRFLRRTQLLTWTKA